MIFTHCSLTLLTVYSALSGIRDHFCLLNTHTQDIYKNVAELEAIDFNSRKTHDMKVNGFSIL